MGCTDNTEPLCLYSMVKLLPPKGRTDIARPQSLRTCTVHLKFYFDYGFYRLYRASEIVQYSYKINSPMDLTDFIESQCLFSTAITLLHLWYIHSGISSVPVQYIYTSLPLCAVRPVHNLSAFRVHL